MTTIHDDVAGSQILELGEALERARRACEVLDRRREELERVLAASHLGFGSIDAATGHFTASAQFMAEFGWPPDLQPEVGAFLARLQGDERERFAALLAASLDRSEDFNCVVRAEWPAGGVQAIELQGRVCRDARGSVERLLLISRNVSAEQLRSAAAARASAAVMAEERQLRQAAETTNRVKDEFLSVISHELRSPLNAILGWNRILSLKRADDPEVAAIAPRIEQSAKAQLKMVNDLADLGRIGTGMLRIEPRPLRLAKVIATAVDLARPAAARKGVELIAELAADVGQIRGDPERLQQVAANLLSNAIKFTPLGGRVLVRLHYAGGMIELSVADTGQGIPAERLPHIFDRLRPPEGTGRPAAGLGLSLTLVREIVTLHGGSVSADSAGPGGGATFIVRLPPGRVPEAILVDSPRHCSLDGMSILVVDDELDARTVVAETLRLEGARVTVSDSASAAFQQLQQAGTHFDIVVSDIGMPDEDGYSLIRKLRALQSDRRTLAIAVTGYVSESDAKAALSAGFDVHVPKPLDFSTFVPMVRRLVAASATC